MPRASRQPAAGKTSNACNSGGPPPAQSGGRLYGKGAKGAVYDTTCNVNDPDTMCQRLSTTQGWSPYKLTLHFLSDETPKVLENDGDISAFLGKATADPSIVAKYFMSSWRSSNAGEHFKSELASIRQVRGIIGDQTAIADVEGVIGFAADIPWKGVQYYVFNARCDASLAQRLTRLEHQEFRALVGNILSTLAELQKKAFLHGDIKPDNIMLCGGTYKLVDWELAKPASVVAANLRNSTHSLGARAYTSPLLFFLVYGMRVNMLGVFTGWKEGHMFNRDSLKAFKVILGQVNNAVQAIINAHGDDREAVYRQYHGTFDLFNFGMVLVKALIFAYVRKDNYDGMWETYMAFAKRCVLLREEGAGPFYSPMEALQEWVALFNAPQAGGANKSKKRINSKGKKGHETVHIGPRGGRYVIRGAKIVYV